VATFPARPTIPARPAAYVRDVYAIAADDADMTWHRNTVIGLAQDLGWPVPQVYAEAGQPGKQLAALVEAIAAGRHDGVVVNHPSDLGNDLAQIEAFDRLCREHGALLYGQYGCPVSGDTRALFEVTYRVTEFTVTDEHLRLLRRAHVFWDEAEFGAPSIDPKRPYGNSNVYADIGEILDVPYSEWDDEELGSLPDARWRFVRLHVETAIALQIALSTGEFRAGRYVRYDEMLSTCRWKRAEA